MPEAQSIGSIEVTIGANTYKLEQAGTKSEKVLKNMDRSAAAATANITRRLVGLAAAFVTVQTAINAFNNALKSANELDKLSQVTGLAVEQLSALKFAAESVGVEFSTLQAAAREWNQRLVEMNSNASGPASLALRTLGISMRDAAGNMRSFTDILPEVATQLSQYADGANKSAIATAIFGGNAAELLPLLNQGADGIEKLMKRAAELGVVLDKDAVVKLQEARKVVAELNAQWAAFSTAMVVTFGPAITAVIKSLTGLTESLGKGIADAQESVRNNRLEDARKDFTKMSEELIKLRTRYDEVTAASLKLNEVVKSGGEWSRAQTQEYVRQQDELDTLTERIKSVMRAKEEADKRMTEFLPKPPVTTPASVGDKPQAPPLPDINKLRAELDEFLRDYFGEVPWVKDWDKLINMVGFEDAMARIDAATKRGVVTTEQATKMKKDLYRQEQNTVLDTANMIGSTLTAVFRNSKTAAIAQATINTATAITKTLATVPWPYDMIQAGLIAAQGAAQIATIRSTTESGGPTPSVSGGSGGGGGAAVGDAGGGGGSRALHIEGFDPAGLYSGKTLEGIVQAINEFVADGGTLISTSNIGT